MKSSSTVTDAPSAVPDPSAACRRRNPYAVLASTGVTTDSTLAQLRDVSFALMANDDVDDSWREAWDELRIAPRRLIVDFFFYPATLEEVSDDG